MCYICNAAYALVVAEHRPNIHIRPTLKVGLFWYWLFGMCDIILVSAWWCMSKIHQQPGWPLYILAMRHEWHDTYTRPTYTSSQGGPSVMEEGGLAGSKSDKLSDCRDWRLKHQTLIRTRVWWPVLHDLCICNWISVSQIKSCWPDLS